MRPQPIGLPTRRQPSGRVAPARQSLRRAWALLGVAAMVLAAGCTSAPTATASFSLSADQLLTRLVETGDSAGFTETTDFGESCADYVAGSTRHQLVVGFEMLNAMRDVELTVRGLPYGGSDTEPALSPIAEPFRLGLVARCDQAPSDLVRKAASIEYIAKHDTYKPI
jgi:hypothetical protein